MSVIVTGMDYPDNCEECKIKSWDIEDYVCPFSGVNTLSIGRQKNCPLRPLPYVHGDLIDRDTIGGKFIQRQAYFTEEIKRKINLIPTIVEAEGE